MKELQELQILFNHCFKYYNLADKENIKSQCDTIIKDLSIQLIQADVVGHSEQLKCKCKNAKFTRTVDSDFNPLCGYCGNII